MKQDLHHQTSCKLLYWVFWYRPAELVFVVYRFFRRNTPNCEQISLRRRWKKQVTFSFYVVITFYQKMIIDRFTILYRYISYCFQCARLHIQILTCGYLFKASCQKCRKNWCRSTNQNNSSTPHVNHKHQLHNLTYSLIHQLVVVSQLHQYVYLDFDFIYF